GFRGRISSCLLFVHLAPGAADEQSRPVPRSIRSRDGPVPHFGDRSYRRNISKVACTLVCWVHRRTHHNRSAGARYCDPPTIRSGRFALDVPGGVVLFGAAAGCSRRSAWFGHRNEIGSDFGSASFWNLFVQGKATSGDWDLSDLL